MLLLNNYFCDKLERGISMENEKLTKRQIQAIQTKEKIYNVAIELMKKKGFDNMTIEEIARNAEVSVGAFYHYFQSKSDILDEIFKQADEYYENTVSIQMSEENALDNILKYFHYYALFNLGRGLDSVKQLYRADVRTFANKDRYMQVLLRNIIKEGQLNNEIVTNESYEAISENLHIVARGVVFDWCLHEGEYDLEERMHKLIQQFLLSLKK